MLSLTCAITDHPVSTSPSCWYLRFLTQNFMSFITTVCTGGGRVVPGTSLLLQDLRKGDLPFNMMHNAIEKAYELRSDNVMPPSLQLNFERERDKRAGKGVRFSHLFIPIMRGFLSSCTLAIRKLLDSNSFLCQFFHPHR